MRKNPPKFVMYLMYLLQCFYKDDAIVNGFEMRRVA